MPFGQSVVVNGKIDLDEIIGNVIVFIPAGLYLQMLKKEWKWHQKVGILAGVSLTFEIVQYIFGIGATDITDLITNTVGGILGVGLYTIFRKICQTEEKTNRLLNLLGGIGTSFMLLFLLILIIAN